MAISGSSTPSAVSGAATSGLPDPVDVVNTPTGTPATERYPGALDPGPYGIPGAGVPPAGAPAGPVAGDYGTQPFGSGLPDQAPGGGYQDASWMTRHDGPSEAWDSNAGAPFAPSGAVNPELHGQDLGATYVKEHVVPAAIGSLTRHTTSAQTWNRVAPTQGAIGQMAQNGRSNLDQQQWHNPEGYSPWEVPYAERPIQNNLAYEATPMQQVPTAYGVAGALPDRSPYDYAAAAYEAPPDPDVSTTPTAAPAAGFSSGWSL
jgi:hypothetical protein